MKRNSKKHLLILVDGPDCVGKTTTINLLSKELGLSIVKMPHMPKYFKTNAEEMSRMFNDTIEQFKDFSFILDRGYPSSIVYSKVFNRKDDLDYLSHHQYNLKPKIFILTADEPYVKDDLVDAESWYKIKEEYESLARTMNWPIINTTKLNPDAVCKKIIENI